MTNNLEQLRDENASLRARIVELEEQNDQQREQINSASFFQLALDMLCIAGFDGYFKYLNPMWSHILGFTDEELKARPFLEFVHPDDRETTIAAASSLTDGDNVVEFVNRYETKDGSYRYILWNSSSSVEQQMIFAVARDITEQRQHEQELSQFQVLVENAIDGIVVSTLDEDPRVFYANRAYCALMGYGRDEIMGLRTSQIADMDNDAARTVMRELREQGFWRGEGSLRRSDGTSFTASITSFLIQDTNGNPLGLGGVIRDISEERQLIEEREALQQQIIQSQQAALREISTPLIPITDDILVMPLIGTIDSQRALQVMESLLEGVATQHAQLVILDVTGVALVDTQVAQALLQAAQAVRLLGAQVMITGIQPQIAQTLVHLGIDMSSIQSHSSLQQGITDALHILKR